MEECPSFSPFTVTFEDHREVTRKYLRSPFSQKSSGMPYNPTLMKKQKAALSLELKRNARKIGKYLKESETVKKLVKVHIDGQNLSGPYVESKTKYPLDSQKGFQSPTSPSVNTKSEFTFPSKLNKSSSVRAYTIVPNIDLSSNEPLSTTTLYRDKTLPDLLPKDRSPSSQKLLTIMNVKEKTDTSIVDEAPEGSPKIEEFVSLREKKELPVSSPPESPARRRTPSLGSGNIKNFLVKYSYKPRENAVDKFVNAYGFAINKSPRAAGSPKSRVIETRVTNFNDGHATKSAIREKDLSQRHTSQERSYTLETNCSKHTLLPQIEEFPIRKIRPRGALHLPKYPPKEELTESMKTFKELYKSCNKLVSNLNSIDKKLTNRENRLHNKYSNLQLRLDKVRDVHFLPQKLVINEDF